jgi:hypothetical protein
VHSWPLLRACGIACQLLGNLRTPPYFTYSTFVRFVPLYIAFSFLLLSTHGDPLHRNFQRVCQDITLRLYVPTSAIRSHAPLRRSHLPTPSLLVVSGAASLLLLLLSIGSRPFHPYFFRLILVHYWRLVHFYWASHGSGHLLLACTYIFSFPSGRLLILSGPC